MWWWDLSQGSGGNGRQSAQLLHCFGHDLEDAVDLGFGHGLQEAEPEAGAGAGFVEAHGHQHVAGLGGAGVAG